MQLQDIITTPVGEVAALPAADLHRLLAEADAWKAQVGAIRAVLDSALEFRYADRAKQKRAEAGKDTGAVRFEDNGYEVAAELPKRIKWDQSELTNILNGIDPDLARHLAKVEVKVDERKFTALQPEIQAELAPARTVEFGKPSYSLKPMGA